MPRCPLPAAPRLPVFALALVPGPAAAARARWTPLGPSGGGILCLAGDPAGRALYAGTAGGVYKSVDGASHWTLLARRIGRQPVAALAVDPRRPATVYAGTAAQGVWKRRDGGASWAAANRGMPTLAMSELAVGPGEPAGLSES